MATIVINIQREAKAASSRPSSDRLQIQSSAQSVNADAGRATSVSAPGSKRRNAPLNMAFQPIMSSICVTEA